jgi:hypothetical protein
MDSIADQIRGLAAQANAAEQLKILNTLNELQVELQDPIEQVFGIYCSVSLPVIDWHALTSQSAEIVL